MEELGTSYLLFMPKLWPHCFRPFAKFCYGLIGINWKKWNDMAKSSRNNIKVIINHCYLRWKNYPNIPQTVKFHSVL
jgi:hypothetical protein